jgi:hypothetical protein
LKRGGVQQKTENGVEAPKLANLSDQRRAGDRLRAQQRPTRSSSSEGARRVRL